MRLQQVATTWTCMTNTLLVIQLVGLDINCIVVTKIWSEWRTFLLVKLMRRLGTTTILEEKSGRVVQL